VADREGGKSGLQAGARDKGTEAASAFRLILKRMFFLLSRPRVRLASGLPFAAVTKFAISLAAAAVLAGCGRPGPVVGVTPIKAKNPAELRKILLLRKPDVADFRLRGPFSFSERTDITFPLTTDDPLEADLFLCEQAAKAPLVIILHGHGNSKEDHAYQAMHVASWGMHGMTVQAPNDGPWIENGRSLARLVKAIRRKPEIVDKRVDAERIILVGHSFGATAVAAALGEGAPALGGVLLDPAGIGRQLPGLLREIKVPVMLIGADEAIWPTRNRGHFFRFIPGAVGEISIRDAVHEDAQYPTEATLRGFLATPLSTEEAQITFVSALTATAFGLSATGSLDYAWDSFHAAFKSGRFYNERRK